MTSCFQVELGFQNGSWFSKTVLEFEVVRVFWVVYGFQGRPCFIREGPGFIMAGPYFVSSALTHVQVDSVLLGFIDHETEDSVLADEFSMN